MTQKQLDEIKVLSANCRGIRDKKKRFDVLNYLQNTSADILCLQDTHLTESDKSEVTTVWNGNFILNGAYSNARGVAIFFSNKFEYEILNHDQDIDGNLLIVDLQISQTKIKVINIYGPNADNPAFYASVLNKIQSSDHDYIIWCGDFNMTLDPSMDSYNYNSINNPRARNYVNNLMSECNFIDLFRHYNPNLKWYTWHKQIH